MFVTPPDFSQLFPLFFIFSIDVKFAENQGLYCYAWAHGTNSWKYTKLLIKTLHHKDFSQPLFACSKSTINTLEQGAKYFKANNKATTIASLMWRHRTIIVVLLVSLLSTLNMFYTLFYCFYYWLWTGKWRQGWYFFYNIMNRTKSIASSSFNWKIHI